ncbi:DUF2073 domain-containing protein [Candidatus Woesearchaeota archaeon]|nr:DUF2073 domain-containing protein [Candidatus Woesearchaeota archaeon]
MLTIQFVPYTEIESLSSLGRIRKLLKIAKENKIVLLEGRLKKEEEAEMIKTTMEEIDDEFKGIEMAVINPEAKENDPVGKMRAILAGALLGNRQGFTIIGPASVVKEITKDPHKIQLLAQEPKRRRKKR